MSVDAVTPKLMVQSESYAGSYHSDSDTIVITTIVKSYAGYIHLLFPDMDITRVRESRFPSLCCSDFHPPFLKLQCKS